MFDNRQPPCPPFPPFPFGQPMMPPTYAMPMPMPMEMTMGMPMGMEMPMTMGMPMGMEMSPGGKLEYPETWPAPTEANLAKAFVPIQQYDKAYHPMQALFRGTLFPELYRPYDPSTEVRR